MKRVLILLFALMAPLAVAEERVVGPSEFKTYAEGWTLYFEREGEPFGSEQFSMDGRTLWRYRDGSCVTGAWRPHGAQLCFLYDQGEGDEVLCWRMVRDKNGLLARLLNGENKGLELRVTGRDRRPLLCGEPGKST
ncbi:MAG: hypothetical protein AAGD13_09165 [Pseudomonadota bacterium]